MGATTLSGKINDSLPAKVIPYRQVCGAGHWWARAGTPGAEPRVGKGVRSAAASFTDERRALKATDKAPPQERQTKYNEYL